jgi:glycosyltransferase involved in cell wall biosynthesis
MIDPGDVAVVIPAQNEASSIGLVLAAIPPAYARRVVVVDNGSTDATAQVAREGGATVISEPVPGYGRACLAGLRALASDPPRAVVFLDGDYSDHPEETPRVAGPVLAGQADLVIGSRVRGEREPGALTPQARFGNLLAVFLLRVLYGARFSDLGPFRAVSWQALQRLDMQDLDFGWTVEMQIKAAQRGLRCLEVPVSYRRRTGKSKISGTLRGSLAAGQKILWWIFKEARTRRA